MEKRATMWQPALLRQPAGLMLDLKWELLVPAWDQPPAFLTQKKPLNEVPYVEELQLKKKGTPNLKLKGSERRRRQQRYLMASTVLAGSGCSRAKVISVFSSL